MGETAGRPRGSGRGPISANAAVRAVTAPLARRGDTGGVEPTRRRGEWSLSSVYRPRSLSCRRAGRLWGPTSGAGVRRCGGPRRWVGGAVALGQGVVELGEDELVFGPVGESFGGDDVGQVGDGDVDTSDGDQPRPGRQVGVPLRKLAPTDK